MVAFIISWVVIIIVAKCLAEVIAPITPDWMKERL
jgi:hypothetical protein